MPARRATHKWEFRPRFRRGAFGWRSQPAIKRVKEAVSEIKKVARKDPMLAAEGAVLLLEKVSPALEQVDGSSGAIGSAVNHAIATLATIIGDAPADAVTREAWMERLFEAVQADEIPYIESLGDHWGTLSASKEVASRWADRFLPECKIAWGSGSDRRGFSPNATLCLSTLLAAERFEELLALLEMEPHKMWHYRQFGVKALVAMGKKAEAVRYAEDEVDSNRPIAVVKACEEILLSSGLADEAYRRYGLEANRAGTYLAWFRAVAKKYPHKGAEEILADLVKETPGEEGKWFAAAKDAKLFDAAIELARSTPCAPQTLTRAARDFAEINPAFAIEAGLLALYWLVEGYGYEISSLDVSNAYTYTMKAAEHASRGDETLQRAREIVAKVATKRSLVAQVLREKVGVG